MLTAHVTEKAIAIASQQLVDKTSDGHNRPAAKVQQWIHIAKAEYVLESMYHCFAYTR